MKGITHYVLGLVMACSALSIATLTTAPSAQAVNCSTSWHQGDNQAVTNVFKNNGTPFRRGPYAACSLISTYPAWADGRYHCERINTNWVMWTHLYLSNWGKNGMDGPNRVTCGHCR